MFKNSILINIFSNWANLLILISVRFLLTPFFIHKLGDGEYGIWILISSVVGYMELLNLGMNTAIIRYISKFIEMKNYKKANEIFNTALFMFLSLAILVVIVVLILANYLPYFFDLHGNDFYIIIFIIVGINLAFEFIFYTFSAILAGQHKFVEINAVGITILLINTLLVVSFLMAGYKLLAIALIQICTNFARGILLSIYSLKTTPELRIDLRSIKKGSFETIFSYTFYNLLMNVSAKINLTASFIIIGHFLSAGAVTFFAIANNLIKYLHVLIIQMQRVLIPYFSQLEARENDEQIRENFLALTRYVLIIAIPIIYVFIFYGNSFITLWVGSKYADLAGKVLTILAIGKLFHITQLATETTLKGISKHKNLSFIKILESISVLILGILLVNKYKLIGMAYANSIPMVFFNLIVIPIYACKLLKISILKYYVKYILKNILAIIPLFFVFYFINFHINSYADFGLLSLAIAVVFFTLSFVLILDVKDRKLIYPLFKNNRQNFG